MKIKLGYGDALMCHAELISVKPRPSGEFYDVAVEWPDEALNAKHPHKKTVEIMSSEGLNIFCPAWRSLLTHGAAK